MQHYGLPSIYIKDNKSNNNRTIVQYVNYFNNQVRKNSIMALVFRNVKMALLNLCPETKFKLAQLLC